MDAIGYLWKEIGTSCIHLPQTHEIVKLFRDVLDDVAPDVAIVTETNVPHADNVSYFGDGHDEAQMVYQFPLAPLVLHALATGDASTTVRLGARAWRRPQTRPPSSTSRRRTMASALSRRGASSPTRRSRRWPIGCAAHGGAGLEQDQPGRQREPVRAERHPLRHPLRPERYQSEPWELKRDRFLCSQAIMLAMAGVPGIYVHSLFGSHNDQAGYARSGWKRDLNHERLSLSEVERRLADPASETARVFAGYRRLLEARRAQPAFHPVRPRPSSTPARACSRSDVAPATARRSWRSTTSQPTPSRWGRQNSAPVRQRRPATSSPTSPSTCPAQSPSPRMASAGSPAAGHDVIPSLSAQRLEAGRATLSS